MTTLDTLEHLRARSYYQRLSSCSLGEVLNESNIFNAFCLFCGGIHLSHPHLQYRSCQACHYYSYITGDQLKIQTPSGKYFYLYSKRVHCPETTFHFPETVMCQETSDSRSLSYTYYPAQQPMQYLLDQIRRIEKLAVFE